MRRRSRKRVWMPLAAAVLLPLHVAFAEDDIRDLRGPKSDLSSWPLPAIGVAVLVFIGALYLIWRRMRRAPASATATPAETALAGLEAARALLDASRAREFCDAASDVVRRYLESQFAVSAQRQTTEEFLQQLASMPASPIVAHQAALTDFLQRSDFVRFSGASPARESLEALYRAARSFILDTSAVRSDPLPAT